MDKHPLLRKGLAIVMVVLLFSISIASMSSAVYQEIKAVSFTYDGDILYVGGNGPNNYSKIQDAINNASNRRYRLRI